MREEVEGEGEDRRPPGGRALAHPEVGEVGSPVISKHGLFVFFFLSLHREDFSHPPLLFSAARGRAAVPLQPAEGLLSVGQGGRLLSGDQLRGRRPPSAHE